jgi:lysophospholipase L1-like esterase
MHLDFYSHIKSLIPRSAARVVVGILIGTSICCAENIFAADGHWVTTWGCGPQLTEPANVPPAPYSTNSMSHSTLRQFVHTTVGGKHLRVRLSNAYGTSAVTINSAHIALASGAGSAGNGDINTATDEALTFRGAPFLVIPPGEVILSDPIAFDLPTLTNLAISIYFETISATTINGHPGSRTTSFILSSNVVSAANMAGATTTRHWYIITGVEVLADGSSKAVVTLGDSLTDGRGSTDDGNNRWPDDLAQRLITNAPTAGVAVVNMGIGAASVLTGGTIPSGLNRFDRDVLNQNGARWLIVFFGVNDIGASGASSSSLINAYTEWANKAHARGLLAYGATITPFGGNSYFTTAHEATRQAVNAWFRTNTLYDGVLDFDAFVRDPVTLTNFQAAFFPGLNANDWLHMNPLGYQAIASNIDLTLFTQ